MWVKLGQQSEQMDTATGKKFLGLADVFCTEQVLPQGTVLQTISNTLQIME